MRKQWLARSSSQIPRFNASSDAVGARKVRGSNDAVVVRMVNAVVDDDCIRSWNEGDGSKEGKSPLYNCCFSCHMVFFVLLAEAGTWATAIHYKSHSFTNARKLVTIQLQDVVFQKDHLMHVDI